MQYFILPSAKEISFSTSILFIHAFCSKRFFKGSIFPGDFVKSKVYYDTGPGFLGHVGTPIICKAAWLFYPLFL